MDMISHTCLEDAEHVGHLLQVHGALKQLGRLQEELSIRVDHLRTQHGDKNQSINQSIDR